MSSAGPDESPGAYGLSRPNLAVKITLFRIAVVPMVVILMYCVESDRFGHGDMLFSWIAFLLFTVAGFSDVLDGVLARKYNMVTPLGALLDPLADKILALAVMVMLTAMGRIPAWLTILLLARETAVTGLRGIAGVEKVVIPAGLAAKWKTVTQMVGLGGMILVKPYWGFDFGFWGMALLYISLILSLYSGVDYYRKYLRQILATVPSA